MFQVVMKANLPELSGAFEVFTSVTTSLVDSLNTLKMQ